MKRSRARTNGHNGRCLTCPYCRAAREPGDNHYADCPVIRRIFGPPRRTCRRCANDAMPKCLLCAGCQAKYKPTFSRPATLHQNYVRRKAKR